MGIHNLFNNQIRQFKLGIRVRENDINYRSCCLCVLFEKIILSITYSE